MKDSKGRIWIGYNGGPGGICLFNDKDETFKAYYPSGTHSAKDVYFIYEASDKELWIGTRNNGLFRYNIAEQSFMPIPIMDRKDLSISYIFKDTSNRLWIGTFGQGLICMNLNGEIIQIFNSSNNQINDNICSILEDSRGRIWISSFYEIAYFDDQNQQFIKYDASNSFPILHVKSMSCLFSNHLLYFGGSNGIVEVAPENLMHTDTHIPRVVLTDFLIHNQPMDTSLRESVLKLHKVKLKYYQDNLTFTFAALNYIYPGKNQYRYKLQGTDNDWNIAGQQRQVTYGNLQAGEYQFIVQVSNSIGVWSEPVKLLSITIEPAPWLSWWAYMIYILLAVTILVVIFYYLNIKMQLEHNLELKNIEKKNLDKMHKFQIDLFTNFSHEIRTPLTLVNCSINDLLVQQEYPGMNQKNRLREIQQHTDKIMKLVNQLMDFRKHDEGRMELEASEQELIPFIQEVALTFGELSSIQNHPIKLHLPEENLRLWYNPQLLEKVFYNVIMNAFKYSTNDSTILLNADIIDLDENPYRNKIDSEIKKAVLISVFNEGDNIPEDKLEKIFEPFYRLKNKKNEQGTGIGLSLNRMIMRLHHSDIWAENVEGRGIILKFLIPLGKEHLRDDELSKDAMDDLLLMAGVPPETSNLTSSVSQLQTDKNKRTLLIAEDNNEIREYLKSKLILLYNIYDCSNGNEALEIIRKKEVDLIISDVMMPVMDGVELCKAVKNNVETNHIPVILLTAHVSDVHVKEGLYSGANDYISKPFKFDLLLVRIQNLLDNNDRLRQSFQKRISPQDMNVEVTDYDKQFLQKCYLYLQEHLSDPYLTIEDFGKEIGISRVHLFRKIKYLTSLSPSRFIMNVRLKVAADLLRQEGVSVSDVCYKVGFNNLSYFTRSFRQSYGVSPSEYQTSHRL